MILKNGTVGGSMCAGSVAITTFSGQTAQTRQGFWFSGGLGYGSLGCDNCGSREGGISGGLSLGGTISPRFLLGVGTSGWTKTDQGARLTVDEIDARVRFYPSTTGGFFVTGGVGYGEVRASVPGFGSATEAGGSAIGVRIRISENQHHALLERAR
jgi:hypothetical protein